MRRLYFLRPSYLANIINFLTGNTYIYVYTYTYIYVCVCMCVYIYIHTHTNIFANILYSSMFIFQNKMIFVWTDQILFNTHIALKWNVKSLSRVWLFVTTTVAYHAPPSMGFSRREYWSGLPFPSPEDLLNPGIKPGSPAL